MAFHQPRLKFKITKLKLKGDRLSCLNFIRMQVVRRSLGISLLMAILALSCLGERAIANTATVLSETEISHKLQQLPGWTQENNKLVKTFEFKDFVAAVDFVNKLVKPAESAGHHPNIAINYNKVTISLTTHDAGGITERDFTLAETISQIAN